MIRPVWVVGVVGHRALADAALLERTLEAEIRAIQHAVDARGGDLVLYASAAAGADLIAIRVARSLGIGVHILLPLEQQEFLEDFVEHPTWRAEAEAALKEAAAHPERDSIDVAITSGRRPECYFDADTQLIRGADLIVGVWDGREADGLGGTGQLLQLALATKKPVLKIDPSTATTACVGFTLETWPPADPQWAWIERVGALPSACGSQALVENSVSEIRNRLSVVARRDATDYRITAAIVIAVLAIAGFVGLANGLLTGRVPSIIPFSLTLVEFVILISVLRQQRRMRRSRTLAEWVDARVAAEMLRGVLAAAPAVHPLHPIAGRLAPHWRRFAVTMGLAIRRFQRIHDVASPDGLAAFREDYIRDRLDHQGSYYSQQLKRTTFWMRWLPPTAEVCSRAGAWFVGAAILSRAADKIWLWITWLPGPVQWAVIGINTVMPAVLPLVAATASAIVSKFDHTRRKKRYNDMVGSIADLRIELSHLATRDSVRRLVTAAEEQLIAEHLEWASAQRRTEI